MGFSVADALLQYYWSVVLGYGTSTETCLRRHEPSPEDSVLQSIRGLLNG